MKTDNPLLRGDKITAVLVSQRPDPSGFRKYGMLFLKWFVIAFVAVFVFQFGRGYHDGIAALRKENAVLRQEVAHLKEVDAARTELSGVFASYPKWKTVHLSGEMVVGFVGTSAPINR